MRRRIDWTPERDALLVAGRRDGLTLAALGDRLGCGPKAVVNRLDRLAIEPHAAPPAEPEIAAETMRDDEPLPAGHPVTWGAISPDRWTINA